MSRLGPNLLPAHGRRARHNSLTTTNSSSPSSHHGALSEDVAPATLSLAAAVSDDVEAPGLGSPRASPRARGEEELPPPTEATALLLNAPASQKRSQSFGSDKSDSTSSSALQTQRRANMRRVALICGSLLPSGAHYSKHSLAPLKPFFVNSMTSMEFGEYLSAASWPVLFVPLIAGLFVDSKGHERGATLFTTTAFIGHTFFALSLGYDGAHRNFYLAILGRVLFGAGLSGAGVVQGAIIAAWFRTEETGKVIGIAQSVHHLFAWGGKIIPALIAVQFDNPVPGIWSGVIVLFVSCGCALAYVAAFEAWGKSFTFAFRNQEVSAEHEEEKKEFNFNLGRVRSLSLAFWTIGALHLLFSNVTGLFSGFAAALLVENFQLSPAVAAVIASVYSGLPIFFSPFVGKYMDDHGGRLTLSGFCAVACLLSYKLLKSHELLTLYFGPILGSIIPMLFLSVSTSATPTLIKSAIPIVTTSDSFGTAFAVYYMCESAGQAVGHVFFGYLRDVNTNYDVALDGLMLISYIALLGVIVAKVLDVKLFNGLLDERRARGGE